MLKELIAAKNDPAKVQELLSENGSLNPAGMIFEAMLAKSKGNIRICTDMTEDEGVVIRRTSDLEHKCLDIILEEEDGD